MMTAVLVGRLRNEENFEIIDILYRYTYRFVFSVFIRFMNSHKVIRVLKQDINLYKSRKYSI